MGKYMRKVNTTADVAVMEVGVRTRAKTLALQRTLCKSSSPAPAPSSGGSYLQLRSRLLELKPPPPPPPRQAAARHGSGGARNPREEVVEMAAEKKEEVGEEASFGENVLEFEARERGTRESTPCSLIRDPDAVRTPGSTTKPTCSAEITRRTQNSSQRLIPTANEMNDFFAGAEVDQQKQFIDKYNFDPINEKPLPGRYKWEKVKVDS